MRKLLNTLLCIVLGLCFCMALASCSLGGTTETTETSGNKTQYTVTFDADNGNATTSKTVDAGSLVEKPETDPSKVGYTFNAWMNGETAWNFETDTVTADVTLVANYVANTDTAYVIKVYLENETAGEYDEVTNEVDWTELTHLTATTDTTVDATQFANDNVPTNYVLNTQNSTLTGTVVGAGTLELVVKYDHVRYTVKFVDGETSNEEKVIAGDTVEAKTFVGKVGYTGSWYLGETDYNFETPVTADIELRANYIANTDTAYTVDLIVTKRDGNTESFGTVTLKGTTDEEIDVDSAIASLKNAVPATTLDETATRKSLAEKTILGNGTLTVDAYYNVAKVTLVENGYTVGGLGLAFNDCYQNTYEVVRTEEVKYGTEEASVKLAFQKDKKYCNFVVDLPQGESTTMLEFHLYNKTGKALEIYTDPSKWSSVTAVSANEGWQLIQLYADPTATFVNVYLRSAGEAEPINTENNTSAVYLSVVNPAVEKQGTYLDFTTAQGVSEARFGTWIGATAESSADKKYNDQNTLKVAFNSTAYGAGFYLEAKTWSTDTWYHDYAQTLKYFLNMANVKSVTLSFMYNASEVTGNATEYIGIGVGANDGMVMSKDDTWNKYEVTITEVWANPIHYVALTNGCGWAAGSFSVGGNLYITNIEYQLHYVDDVDPIKVVASTAAWQDPASVVSSTEFVYGTETTSVKVTTQAGYTYASLVLQNTSSATDYCVQFYILNKTGKALDIYTDHSKFSGVKTYEASDEWQLVTLWCNPEEDTQINIRGAGETVINDASVAFYISEVKPAQQPA